MLHQLISRSPDLKQLRDEGFQLEIKGNYLVIHAVPYVDSGRQVRRGLLVMELTRRGDEIVRPETHVAMFAGSHPCDSEGRELQRIKHGSNRSQLVDDLWVDHSFSSKPVGKGGYDDYYHKVTTYVALISGPVASFDSETTARTFAPMEGSDQESVFRYVDTASSRANIEVIAERLALPKVAIVGLTPNGT